jgi:tetratricopeptide (TPR) repeat protein
MKKLTFLMFTLLFAGQMLQAQSVDEARKNLYYGRITSAIASLERAVASNPKDADAIYWLGQAHLNAENVAAAKTVYQTALQAGVNAPLVWVGMGHVELLEGKKNEARQRFEAAITNSKNKNKDNPAILNAIGRANADGPSTAGDPMYAIDLLRRAATLDAKNPEIPVNIGINYLKLGDRGGDAYGAFEDALRIDPTYARANYRLGKIFLSQNNVSKFEEYYNKAIQADPKFAPAYLDLYNYYALRDVNKARGYLESYMANTDKDCSVDFFYADYLFRAGKYQESLDKAKAMENGACKTYPRLKVLYAYNYDRLGDSVQAQQNMETYMNTAAKEKIVSDDYLFAASVSKKVAGGEQNAINYLMKALEFDTVRANRVQYMDTIAGLYKKMGKHDERIEWLRRSYNLNPNPSDFDLYNWTDAAISAGRLTLADSLASAYIQKRPEQEFGYSLKVRAAKANDPDSTRASAFPAIDEYINFLSKDSVKNMNKIRGQYYYMALTSVKMKDYAKGASILERLLVLDPQNAFALQNYPILKKAASAPAQPSKPTPPAKPATKETPTKVTPKTPPAKTPVKTTSTKTTTKKN